MQLLVVVVVVVVVAAVAEVVGKEELTMCQHEEKGVPRKAAAEPHHQHIISTPHSRNPATRNPIITPPPSHHRYERSAIATWLKNHWTSPMTNQQLVSTRLVPNVNLRQMMSPLRKVRPAARSRSVSPPRSPVM